MITGYNSDVEHGGVVYHVQTEDKGLETPLILSLVYTGGAILASRRTPYRDLIKSGFDENVLTERLKRQHRLICAAIKAGRIEELKRRPELAPAAPVEEQSAPIEAPGPPANVEQPSVTPPLVGAASRRPSAYTVYDPRRQLVPGQKAEEDEGLRIGFIDQEQPLRSGEALTLQILVTEWSGKEQKPVNGAAVSVKVLGTSFRPLIYSAKTGREGVSSIAIKIPQFNSGRAAILVRATARELSTETRRVIHPGR